MFGTKSERDMKAIRPILDKILAAYPDIDRLSDDDLRARSAAIREEIRLVEKPFEDRLAAIRQEMEKEDIPVERKVSLSEESDKLVKIGRAHV